MGTRDTILFWEDLWNGRILKLSYPELYSFVKNKNITVTSMTALGELQHGFSLPLSEIAYDQFCEVTMVIQSMQLIGDKDVWSYIQGNTQYSSQKA
jgi:hypothetical protein